MDVPLNETTEEYEVDIIEKDDSFGSVVSLLPFDGADGDTVTTDLGDEARTWTFEATAQIDTAQSQFGVSSLLLDGDSDRLTISDSEDFAFGSGDFTIETFVRFNVVQNSRFITQWESGNLSFTFGINPSNELQFGYSTTGSDFVFTIGTWGPSIATWYHVAVSRNGNDLKIFVDGTQVGSTTDMTGVTIRNSNDDITIGDDNGSSRFLDGWVDEMRVTKGVGRYSEHFTAPTQPFLTSATQDRVLRTFTELTAETVTYTAAQQAADFGGAKFPVQVSVYQLSEAVGRGKVRGATLA